MKKFSMKKFIAGILSTIMVTTSLNITPIEVSAAETSWNYGYTGSVQEFTAPYTGVYELKAWGASGGGANSTIGGMGGYTYATVKLTQGQKLYMQVGQQGSKGGG